MTIVENQAGHWRVGEEWVVEREPMLEIGLMDGPPEYLLSSVTSAVRLSDGTVAIGDRRGQVIRLYDAAGRYLTTFGGEGDGPGELRSARLGVWRGDSILAVDVSARRLSIFHADEGYVRSVALPPDLGSFGLIGVFENVVIGWALMPVLREPGMVGIDSMEIVSSPLDGTGFATLGRFPWDSYGYAFDLGPSAIAAVSPRGLWYGEGDAFEVRQHSVSGEVMLTARYLRTPEPIAAETLSEIEQEGAAGPVPEHYPPYSVALSDSEGYLWVASHRIGIDANFTWRVLSPDGRLMGEVEMPTGFVPYQIGRDFVLVRHWNEFQVEYVHLHRLRRGGDGA